MDRCWTKKLSDKEASLFQTKWWDARFWHPVIATYAFAELFTLETRRIIRTHINNEPPKRMANGAVRDWNPIKSGDIFEYPTNEKKAKFYQRKITGLIKARQIADTHGIPYDFFIARGLHHWYFGRFYFTQNRTMPEPNMLYNEDCLNAILTDWVEAIKSKIQVASSQYYRIEQKAPSSLQMQHAKWVTDQISRKVDPKPALRKFINANYVPLDFAIHCFGEDVVKRAISM